MKKQVPSKPIPSGFVPIDALYKQVESILARQLTQMKIDSGRVDPKKNELTPADHWRKKA